MDFPGDSGVKNPPAMQDTWVQSLGQEEPLKKGMKKINKEGNAYSLQGCKEPDTTEQLTLPSYLSLNHYFLLCI